MLPIDVLEALKRISDRSKETAARVRALEETDLRGPEGPPGPQGERGERGPEPTPQQIEAAAAGWLEEHRDELTGPQGEQGPKGESIVGPPGPAGRDGRDGESIVGPPGPMGPPGKDAPPAKDGAPGKDGRDGVDGQDGVGVERIEQPDETTVRIVLTDGREFDFALPRGPKGERGPAGASGRKGKDGEQAAGSTGTTTGPYVLSGGYAVIEIPATARAVVTVVDEAGQEVSVVVRHEVGRVILEAFDLSGLTAYVTF